MSFSVVESDATGEQLYNLAEKIADGQVYSKNTPDILVNFISEEGYVIGENTVLALHTEETAYDAVCALVPDSFPILARLWEDGSLDDEDRQLIFFVRPGKVNDVWEIRDLFPSNFCDDIVSSEDGFQYVDGMIYHEKDVQLLPESCEFITRPWANENVSEYLDMLSSFNRGTYNVSAKLLGGCAKEDGTRTNYKNQLENHVFDKYNGEFDNGMYRSSSQDDPQEIAQTIREEYGEDTDVVFRVTSHRNPFETRWETWYRE